MTSTLRAAAAQIFLLLAFLGAGSSVALAQGTSEEVRKNLCGGANLTFDDGTDSSTNPARGSGGDSLNRSCGKEADPQRKVNNLITQIINVLSIIVGIVAVIMIIYGGFRFITSGGDSGAVSTAKNTILYAIVGLIIVALAQFIVKFVLAKTTQ